MISAAVSRNIPLSAWWLQRTPRERVLVTGMAVVALLYLLVVAAVDPLFSARSQARASITASEAALARLEALPANTVSAAAASEQPAAAILTETASAFGLAIRRIEPEGDGARLTIEDAGFSEIVHWIDSLEKDHGLHVVAIEMDRRPEPGVVSANLTLKP